MDASVIVPTYRGEKRIRTLLEALAQQDYDGDWEVVVSMDGEADDTRAVVDEYAGRLDVRCIASAAPRGVALALNSGFSIARGRVLIRCDDDFTPAPDMVRRHVEWHQGSPRIGVSCAYRDVEIASAYGRTYGLQAARSRREQWYARPPQDRWIDWAGHNSVTREVWDEVGGFDPRFRYGQDSELGWRLSRIGVTIVVDPALEIEHRGAPVAAVNRVPRAFVAGASRRQFTVVHGESHVDHEAETPEGLLHRAWNAITFATAVVFRSEQQYRRLGAVVDAVLRVAPRPVGRRVAAWAIESAARAGERFGPDSLEDFAHQKDREITTEQADSPKRR
jgi:glycosyltransferase involved in cell wall biosynthesis